MTQSKIWGQPLVRRRGLIRPIPPFGMAQLNCPFGSVPPYSPVSVRARNATFPIGNQHNPRPRIRAVRVRRFGQ